MTLKFMSRFRFFILPFCLLLISSVVFSQPIGNEWINYNQTYWKISVAKNGLYRVPLSALPGAPTSVTGASFQLFRDGKEVPLRTTTAGTFGAADYIEFYGRKSDGKLDRWLYADSSWQLNDQVNMFTDTAVYFLTITNTSGHARFQVVNSSIPSTPPSPPDYCLSTVRLDFVKGFSPGRNLIPGMEIQTALFDRGEGLVDTLTNIWTPLTYALSTPNAVPNSIDATVRISLIRHSYYTGQDEMRIYLNNQQVGFSKFPFDTILRMNFTVPSSSIQPTSNILFSGSTPSSTLDEYGVASLELEYPRDYDCNNRSAFRFSLPPSPGPTYLEFTNFATGSTPPRLFDLTNEKLYTGDLSVAGKVRFYIDPSLVAQQFFLIADNSNEITTVATTTSKTFKNYRNTAEQGNYIIISHSNYNATTNGKNYVTEYQNYRKSAAGGGFNAIVADVGELYDQFAYGQNMHPLAIQRFLRYAYDSFSVRPQFVFLIGKGLLYHKYRTYLKNPGAYPFAAIVPTWGDPGADNDFVTFLPNRLEAMSIGRLTAWKPEEVGAYLAKVQSYENALKEPAFPTHESELWKKLAIHMGGGRNAGEQALLLTTLNIAAGILEDTSYGGLVTTVSKSSTNPIDILQSKEIDSIVNNGFSLLSFNGHATSNGFDFGLKDPETYTTVNRFPHFIALGCDVAQIFNLTTSTRTLSERHILTPVGGSISVLASNNLQFPAFHRTYLPILYKSISTINYGSRIGVHQRFAYDSVRKTDQSEGTYYQLESLLMQGDPALGIFGFPKPDFHIAANRLSSIPANVTNTVDSFTLKIVAFNLAKAINDSVRIKVEHINPGGITTEVAILATANLYNTDTLYCRIGIDKISDIGLNKYRVTIDDDNRFDEMNEANNAATFELFIYSDKLVPVFPREFSIVHQPSVTLKASTLNPFRETGRYRFEIDTTALFNSPLKQQTSITSKGGVLKWTPAISLLDSTVYYWRTSFDSAVNGEYQWSVSSFIFLAHGSDGWNQSHYFQYRENSFSDLSYGADRKFAFPTQYNSIRASNAIYFMNNSWPWNTADYVKVTMNGVDIQRLGCWPWDGTVQINVFDKITNMPWKNDSLNGTSGAYPSCLGTNNIYTFEFPVNTQQGRANAAHFLDSIPDGNFVLVRNVINLGKYDTSYVDEWKTDPGQNLYVKMKQLGFDQIDSFNQIRPFIFFRRKADAAYPVYQAFGKTMQDTIIRDFLLPTTKPEGEMRGVTIGPAKVWQQLKWKYSSDAHPEADKPFVRIYGLEANNNSTLLYQGNAKDTSLSFINASQYPRLNLVWTSLDSVKLTSPQLNYWRVLYSPVPEAALNPAAWLVFNDSLQAGQPLDFSVAIENLTDLPMDSILVRYKLIDGSNNTHILANKRYRRLPGNDTLHADFSYNPQNFVGKNIFFIEANPDNDQPEQYHPNNLGYLPFEVVGDQRNPLVDVTFDGVHILDGDIVSAKPFIKVSLRDENKYLRLDDTSLLKLRLRYPSDLINSREIPFDGSICKFVPATSGNKNEAFIEFRPDFTNDPDGKYQLIIDGKDKSGNNAGDVSYKIAFEVVRKSTITHVLNYPNPFSTSTAFVFTLTGYEIPSQFKIQIMTVTGKVVKEITKAELGPIHIGRNISTYKWDGRDQYGQLLGNGVYFYRVITSIKGNDIEHRSNMDLKGGNEVDKFFKNGWGKMYIMR